MCKNDRIGRFAAAFQSVTDHPSPRLALSSFSGSAAAFAAVSLATQKVSVPCVMVVTPGLPEMDSLVADLAVLAEEASFRVLEFPPALEEDHMALAARLRTAAALGAYALRPYPLVIVAPFAALAQPVPVSGEIEAAIIRLEKNGSPEGGFDALVKRLVRAGYERVPEVVSRGTFAVRGGVVDVWPPVEERPFRAEFFGDEVESLRTFDPGLQTSTGDLVELSISPIVLEGRSVSILSCLPVDATYLWLEHNAYTVPSVKQARREIFTGDPAPAGVPCAGFQSVPLPGFAELGPEVARQPELLEVAKTRLHIYLASARKGGFCVVEDDRLESGFEVPGLVVVTKRDRVFAHRRTARSNVRGSGAGERLTETFDIEPGEYVVHLDYGIGRFEGSTEVEVAGRRHEVFTIEYADGGRLHVPVTHAHLLSRYVGVKGEQVKLHRLDGKRWARDKEEAQKAVQDLAASLLETQARRAVVPGCAYDTAAAGVAEFEAAFPYEVTPDQAAAIDDVKKDMAATRPMDRLICGDAGYGKTEVAMRAACIAAMNGRQTALLAPTTVLAEQHYETFLARFDGTPIRIETMSRFQSPEAKKGTRARLLSGATDIVIGTHALLSNRTAFHDLGLIIIDEEQRFGVRHKEFLKRLRATADVLTMSATPIPRTLYLSMTGTRDLSLLRTPPRERVAVETRIVRDSDPVIRTAIRREMARGGQTYFLHNRVMTIEKTAARLQALVPEARIEIAHGQMPSSLLAAKMQRFSRGESDVLLCTTIVESGLDIPRANTILIDRADMFGLAELYQLRGRVGRAARQGYAWFLLPETGSIDAEARERLDALKKQSGLGAGFNIALRDLEIRGAGNLLGSEQSGHIAAVGFQLYCQLLQRTVARLKGEAVPDLVDVSLNFDFLDFSPGSADVAQHGACLPYDYVEEDAQRMDFHARLASSASLSDVRKLRVELADRYGRLPKAALRLVKMAEMRVLCAQAKISRIDVRGARAVFWRAGRRDPAFVRQLEAQTPEQKIAALAKYVLAAPADEA